MLYFKKISGPVRACLGDQLPPPSPLPYCRIIFPNYSCLPALKVIVFFIAQKKDFPSKQFFVVFVIKPEDYTCGGSRPPSIQGRWFMIKKTKMNALSQCFCFRHCYYSRLSWQSQWDMYCNCYIKCNFLEKSQTRSWKM